MTDNDNPKEDGGKLRKAQGTSVIEWIAAGIGGLLFTIMIAYMIVAGMDDKDGVPSIEIVSATPVRQGSAFIIKFEARNIGNQTASGLVVKATLSRGETEIETAEATIDYLPTGSTRSGGFFFKHDPKDYVLDVIPVSYADP
jgi:uncharacterized protein (TIGR02588 family)